MTEIVDIDAIQTLDQLDETARKLLFTEARTANTFAPTPVTDSELTDIWELAKWPPTAMNSQPMRVLYVREGEGRERLVEHMKDNNKSKTASAPAVAVLALDTHFHEYIPTLAPHLAMIKDMLESNETMRLNAARFNSALQAGYFIMSVRAHGLAAGPMEGFDKEGVDADFFPDGRWKSILVVNIGHPGISPWRDRLPRLDQSETLAWA